MRNFEPALRVLTAEPEHPEPPALTFDAILARFPSLSEAEAVCWTGSTAAGWGNPLSDVDLFAFSDHELELPVDETAETWPSSAKNGIKWFNWMGRYEDVCVDLQVWPTDALERVLAPYNGSQEPEFCGMSDSLQDLIYRTSIAVPLKNAQYFQDAKTLISNSSYSRSLARILKANAENQLNDVAGQLAAGDETSARLTATLAARDVADHCLVMAGQLCRRRKWLMRRLAETPECGITADEYAERVLSGPRQGESDGAWALGVARWAQYHLIRIEDAVLTSAGRPTGSDQFA